MSKFETLIKLENLKWILPLVLSIIAISITIRNCQQTDPALKLNKAEFESERTVILQGEIINKNTAVDLSCVNEKINIQRTIITYPVKLNISKWVLYPPKLIFSLELLRERLQNILDRRIKRNKDLKNSLIINFFDSIPITIETTYIAKGKAYTDISLYLIDYSFGIKESSEDPPFINFRGLVYQQRLHLNDDTSFILNSKLDTLRYLIS